MWGGRLRGETHGVASWRCCCEWRSQSEVLEPAGSEAATGKQLCWNQCSMMLKPEASRHAKLFLLELVVFFSGIGFLFATIGTSVLLLIGLFCWNQRFLLLELANLFATIDYRSFLLKPHRFFFFFCASTKY